MYTIGNTAHKIGGNYLGYRHTQYGHIKLLQNDRSSRLVCEDEFEVYLTSHTLPQDLRSLCIGSLPLAPLYHGGGGHRQG